MSNSEILWGIVLGAIGIGISVISFFLKVAWNNAVNNAKEVADLKLDLGKQKGTIELLEQKLETSLKNHEGMHDLKFSSLKDTMDKLVKTVEHLDGNIRAQTELYMQLMKKDKE